VNLISISHPAQNEENGQEEGKRKKEKERRGLWGF
jgi:hypothetical protein